MARRMLITRRDYMQDAAASFDDAFGHWPLPLVNMLDRRPQIVAEAADSRDWAATKFKVDLGYTRKVGLIWFANLRTSPMGLISIKAGTDATFASNAYETLTTTWPPDGSDPFDYNAWGELALTHTYMRDEYEKLGMTRFFVPPAVINCRYIWVEIRDSCLRDTPLQIGCFGASEVWEPPLNFTYGWRPGIIDESELQRVPKGSTYIEPNGTRRRLNFGFPALPEAEVWARSFGLALIKGKSDPVLVVPFPDDETLIEKQGLYGLFTDGSISNPFFGRYEQVFQADQEI